MSKETKSPAPVVDAAVEPKNAVEVENFLSGSGVETARQRCDSPTTKRCNSVCARPHRTSMEGFEDRHFLGMNDDLVTVSYTIYRVDPARWSSLQPALRPRRLVASR